MKQKQFTSELSRSGQTALVTALLLLVGVGAADQFTLTSGARVRGEWVNRKERPVNLYVIRLASGGTVRLHRSQVAERLREQPALAEYESRAPTFDDSLEQNWQLAEWCRARGLDEQRAIHLRRIIELDPSHAKAWRGLGYSQIDGQWVKRDDVLKKRGYVFFEGKWRLPEEKSLIQARRVEKRAELAWLQRIKIWREQLDGEHHDEALDKLETIESPIAVRALNTLLTDEPERDARLLYVKILGQIPGEGSAAALVIASMNHVDEEVFFAAIGELKRRQNPQLVNTMAQSLKVQDNVQVNRAANALGQLGDPQAIPPLIEALVTTHKRRNPDAKEGMNFLFSRANDNGVDGGCANPTSQTLKPGQMVLYGPPEGIGMVANQPTTEDYQVANHEALDALVKLSGVSFGFDKQAWRNWHASRQGPNTAQVSTRRQ